MDYDNQNAQTHPGMHNKTVSLRTSFMGIALNSPIIAGACPLNTNRESIRQMVAAGVGAVVLPSMLQEQLVYHSQEMLETELAREPWLHKPQLDRYNGGPETYLKTIETIKSGCTVPIIASIHGATIGKWLDYVLKVQDAGADGLEVNWQIGRCDPHESGEQVESRMLKWVTQIREKASIPIAFKMNSRFTNPASVAIKLQNIGINGLVLFAHRPHWDVDTDRMHWTIGWELSPIASLGQTLQGIVETCTSDLKIAVAASGGVRSGNDAIKTMIAGADAAMVVSEIYRQGPDAISDILAGIQRFLDTNHFPSLEAFRDSRPHFDERPGYSMRSEIIDPLTSSIEYYDPTPVARQISGDSFGHPSH